MYKPASTTTGARPLKEGNRVRHWAEPDMSLRVIRVDRDWFGATVVTVRDLEDGATFRVNDEDLTVIMEEA